MKKAIFLNFLSKILPAGQPYGRLTLLAVVLLAPTFVAASSAEPAQLSTAIAKILPTISQEMIVLQNDRPVLGSIRPALMHIYAERGFVPLWFDQQGPTRQAVALLQTLQQAPAEGLNPEEYHLTVIRNNWTATRPALLAQADVLLTAALLRYAQDLSYGHPRLLAADPLNFTEIVDFEFDPSAIVTNFCGAAEPEKMLASLAPTHIYYQQLKKELSRYRRIAANGPWQTVPAGKVIKPGEQDSRMPLIGKRLIQGGDLPAKTVVSQHYGREIEKGVRRFQKRHGIWPDGIIGKSTVATMNIPVQWRIDQISINMARWRWHNHELGKRYAMVNIANAHLQAYEQNKLVLNFPVIVGKQENQTPLLTGFIRHIEFNPSWNIPPSIAKNEQLKKLRANPRHLVEKKIRLFAGWDENDPELDSTKINWAKISPEKMTQYRLRQDPGPLNSLGRVKFIFPNPWSVYLHDTPGQALFSEWRRDMSHGCIRVHDPVGLAKFVLNNQDRNASLEAIRELFNNSRNKEIVIHQPVPIHITYQTVWFDKDRLVRFDKDVYGQDEKIAKVLKY